MARGQRTRQNTDSLPTSHRRNNGGANRGKGVVRRASVQSRGYASRRQRRILKPYTPENYSQDACIWFSSAQSWENGQSRLLEGIKKLEFSENFYITDAHLTSIMSKGPSLCHSLLDFRAGDAETGNGGGMSDAVVIRFAEACPNLVHISLDGAINLTDESLVAIMINCPNLRYVQFSGNDKVHGRLTGPALDALRNRPEMGKHLIKMRLTDQQEFDKQFEAAVRRLSAARKSLAIEVGNTCGKDGGVNTWIGGKEIYGYQAFDGPGGFDSYGGFGGPW